MGEIGEKSVKPLQIQLFDWNGNPGDCVISVIFKVLVSE